jgi:hypothetical protein
MVKMQHDDRVGDLKPVDVGSREDWIDLLERNGWYQVHPDTGKPKD